jgi:hypothetical protein
MIRSMKKQAVISARMGADRNSHNPHTSIAAAGSQKSPTGMVAPAPPSSASFWRPANVSEV